jgi:hypothetical protein
LFFLFFIFCFFFSFFKVVYFIQSSLFVFIVCLYFGVVRSC